MSYRQRKSWLPHCGLSSSSASNIECCLMPLIALAWKLSSLATMTRKSSLPRRGYCLPLLQRVLPHALLVVAWKLSSSATMTQKSSLPRCGYCLPLPQRVLPHAFNSGGLEAIIISNYEGKSSLPCYCYGRLASAASNRECCLALVLI